MATFKRERTRLPCAKCGFLTDADYKFCASCGAPLPGANAYVEPGDDVPAAPRPARSLRAVASVVLGVAAAFPLGLLAGIPAVVLGAMVIRRKETGTGLAIAGIALGLAGILVTSPAMVLPRLLRTSPAERRARLEAVMEEVQAALDNYARQNGGVYPGEEAGSAGDGTLPEWLSVEHLRNPFTNRPYECGLDFFYVPDRLRSSDDRYQCNALSLGCLYSRLAAPESVPGTVMALGYTDPESDLVTAYVVVGFGADVTEPLSNMVPVPGEFKKEKVYHVLSGGIDDEPADTPADEP